MRRLIWLLALTSALLAVSCGDDDDSDPGDGGSPTGGISPSAQVSTIVVESSAFAEGEEIPVEYTCEGDNLVFPLSWSGAPGETVSYVLIFDDPDAPGDEPFLHWLMYDIPANMSGFESVSKDERLPNGAAQGENGRGEIGYTGPCPPEGETHTYVVTVYAMDAALGLEPGASRDDVEAAMEWHELAFGDLGGTFGR
jgi:Raf kinase inhibitor-like YbhB/YbcL family protein